MVVDPDLKIVSLTQPVGAVALSGVHAEQLQVPEEACKQVDDDEKCASADQAFSDGQGAVPSIAPVFSG